MKKIYGLLACLFLLVCISGCAKKADILILQEFWNQKEVADKDSMKFVTGLEIIFPKEWQGNIVTDIDTGSNSSTISICEKENAEDDEQSMILLKIKMIWNYICKSAWRCL